MTYDEMVALRINKNQSKTKLKPNENQTRIKRKPNDEEHRIQCACVAWFRLQYPKFASLLYAVPNGGRRDAITGKRLKDEGVIRGVSDLILDVPNAKYHGLRIEMKTKDGSQSKEQKEYQKMVESMGYKYILCRSLESFIKEITVYLKNW